MQIPKFAPRLLAPLLITSVLACGEPAGADKTIDGALTPKRRANATERRPTEQHKIPQHMNEQRNLEIELLSGEFAQWSDKEHEGFIESPASKRLTWTNLRSDLEGATWRVHLGSAADKGGTLLAEGPLASIPAQNQSQIFSIDFAEFLPGYPPTMDYDLYVQIVGETSANSTVNASQPLLVRYHRPSDYETKFVNTVKTEHPELYANSPMTVEIHLEKLSVNRKNDDDGEDEPYLMVVPIAVDGTTVKMTAFSFGSATVRLFKSAGTHANVPSVDGYGTVTIPDSTGHFEFQIDPLLKDFLEDYPDVGGKIGEIVGDQTKVYLLVIAMEQDNATKAAADAAREALLSNLQSELDTIVQSLTLADLQSNKTPTIDIGELSKRLEDAALDAAIDKSLDPANGWWTPVLMPVTTLLQAANPDDFVGASVVDFSFTELLEATKARRDGKLSFSLSLTTGGPDDTVYTVKGFARRVAK